MAKASSVPAKKKKASAPVAAKKKAGVSKVVKPVAAVRMAKAKGTEAKTPAKKAAVKQPAPKQKVVAKTPVKKAPAKMAPARNTPVAKTAEKKSATSKRAPVKVPVTVSAKVPAKVSAKQARSAPAKTVAVKKAAPRRSPSKSSLPPTRRGRVVVVAVKRSRSAAPVKPAPQGAAARPPQNFTVSHLSEGDFRVDGLRPYAQYRDLGIAAATAGLCQAHVIRFIPPTTDEVRKRHTHTVDLQLVYVLKGWMKNEFEGHGEQMMSTGSCWLQPSGIEHTVLEYSPDCEVLEIIVPADFKTQDVD